MSSYSLRGLGAKFYRHAFILAQRAIVHSPKFSQSPAIDAPARQTHNGLYDMVKKRTLEARAKMNQQPTDQNDQKSIQSSSSSSSHKSSSNNFHNPLKYPFPSFAKGVQTGPNKDIAAMADVCHNTKILGATGCQPVNSRIASGGPCGKPRSGPSGCDNVSKDSDPCKKVPNPCPPPRDPCPPPRDPCPPPRDPTCPPPSTGSYHHNRGGGGHYVKSGTDSACGGGGDDKKTSALMKALYVLLAALGVGGLWLLMRSGKEKKVIEKIPDDDCLKKPLVKPTLPKSVPYLLIGGGTAAFSAFRSIKINDPHAKVLMITNERHKPYMRPPLSKELWYSAKNDETSTPNFNYTTWSGAQRSIFFEPEQFFVDPEKLMDNPNGGISVAHGFIVKKVDPVKHKVTLDDGYEICYDKCLIATGCTPKNLPVFQNAAPSVKEKVIVFRTPEDFERLKYYVDQRKSIMIVGNGFIGSELACSLATYSKNKCSSKIYQVFPETGNMSRVLPDYLSRWTTRKVEQQGVCVIPEASVKGAQRDEQMLKIALSNGNTVLTDVVVVCVGCDPNTNLAYPSGLEVHPDLGGFVVNCELEARNDLFVAGDASCFYDPLLGRRRVEHHDHSIVSGKLAGENMVGKNKKPYNHQSMFWSDLGPEIGYEAIGLVDSSLPTVGVFALAPKVERPKDVDHLTDQLSSGEKKGTEVSVSTSSTEKSSSSTEKSVANTEDPTKDKCDSNLAISEPEKPKANTSETTTKDTVGKKITPNDLDNAPCDESFGKGVIFYLKNDKVVGILMWNLFQRVGLARAIINQNTKYEDLNEVAKLFNIHS